MVGTSKKSVPGMAIELPFSIGKWTMFHSYVQSPENTQFYKVVPQFTSKLVTTTMDEANEWVYCRYIEPVHGVVIQFLIGVDHILTTYINQSTMIYQSDHHIFTYK